jgi:16S rRNA A1518/A1519 N6-dimethyltransferase RsmA/KsgA/DIM1 with predicted DNA glycosylase/AP lyase activity
MFYPAPPVDSVVVRFLPWKVAPFVVKDEAFFRHMVRWLFTQRNKKLGNALVPFLKSTLEMGKDEAKKLASVLRFRDKRVRELTPKDFGALANDLAR